MKIKISEVWNATGRSEVLAIIDTDGKKPLAAVWAWINANRPDLELADGLYSHGFHAVETKANA